jgi:hypothetical protein
MKVTARNLDFARERADKALRRIDPHAFKGASKQSLTRLQRKERRFCQSCHE